MGACAYDSSRQMEKESHCAGRADTRCDDATIMCGAHAARDALLPRLLQLAKAAEAVAAEAELIEVSLGAVGELATAHCPY